MYAHTDRNGDPITAATNPGLAPLRRTMTRATHPCPLVRDWRCAVPCFADDCRDPDKHEE